MIFSLSCLTWTWLTRLRWRWFDFRCFLDLNNSRWIEATERLLKPWRLLIYSHHSGEISVIPADKLFVRTVLWNLLHFLSSFHLWLMSRTADLFIYFTVLQIHLLIPGLYEFLSFTTLISVKALNCSEYLERVPQLSPAYSQHKAVLCVIFPDKLFIVMFLNI